VPSVAWSGTRARSMAEPWPGRSPAVWRTGIEPAQDRVTNGRRHQLTHATTSLRDRDRTCLDSLPRRVRHQIASRR
jgi:hypothetical protein